MALADRKMPIITGVNDTPSTTGGTYHPNGALICSQLNALIDNELTTIETAVNSIPVTTDDLTEGTTNKYFNGKTTDDLTEGVTNKYFSGKTTDDLSEGTTNKYFADSLARGAISVAGNGSYDSATGVITISNASITVDHISLTNTTGLIDTYTLWGDVGETINIGTYTVTNGADGANGVNGANGIDGADGADGSGIDHVTSVDNGNGTHTVTYWGDVGETINLGTSTLNDGVDGADGVSPQVSVLTQASYDALGSYDANTFYVING